MSAAKTLRTIDECGNVIQPAINPAYEDAKYEEVITWFGPKPKWVNPDSKPRRYDMEGGEWVERAFHQEDKA